jgi:hypothetical protein
MVFLRRESSHAHKENVLLGESQFRAPCRARRLRRGVQIDGNTVPNHAATADAIHTLQACRYFAGYRHRDNALPVYEPLEPARTRLDFTLGDVVHGVHHQPGLEVHQRRKRISHHVHVGVHDVRAKFPEDAMQAVVGAPAKSWFLAKEPGLYSILIQLLLQIGSNTPAEGNYCRFKALGVKAPHDVDSHAFSAAGAKVCKNMEHTIFHDSP